MAPQLLYSRSTDPVLINSSDLQQILSDALLSFSPLATLVGADSARSLTQHVSNNKQTFVASMAPIGALGMMATVCKGAHLPGLKDMLGVGEADILDACAELGCGALNGVVPRMSKRGGLSTAGKEYNRGIAACGIIRVDWSTRTTASSVGANEKMDKGKAKATPDVDLLDFDALRKVVDEFSAGTMSGRMRWDTTNAESQATLIRHFEQTLLQSLHGSVWDPYIFSKIDSDEHLRDGEGMVELHWPSPAMPMETHPWVVFAFGAAFIFVTLAVVVTSTTHILSWQGIPAAVLLVGGQFILAIGQAIAQLITKHQRESIYFDIPKKGLAKTWMLVDNTWFTSMVAHRPISFHPLRPHQTTIGQHFAMKSHYIPTWQAICTLLFISVGFLAFYVGGKSASIKTVIIYIGLFLIANICKGHVVSYANKPYITHLNNIGYIDVVKRSEGDQPKRPWWNFWEKKKKGKVDDGDSSFDAAEKDDEDDEEEGDIPLPITSKGVDEKGDGPACVLDREDDKPGLNALYADGASPEVHDSLTPHKFHDSPVSQEIPLPDEKSDPPRPPPSTSKNLVLPLKDSDEPHLIPLPPSRHATKDSLAPSLAVAALNSSGGPQISYRVYAKIALRHPLAIGMFYFSRAQEWAMAAHVIWQTCQGHIPWSHSGAREPFLYLPFDFWEKRSAADGATMPVSAALVLAIDEMRHEDIFWSAAVEFVSIVLGNFTSTSQLPSESHEATDAGSLGLFVYHATKLILTSARELHQQPLTSALLSRFPGVVSLMRAIDLVRSKYPFDDSVHTLPAFRAHAAYALQDVMAQMHAQQGPDSQEPYRTDSTIQY